MIWKWKTQNGGQIENDCNRHLRHGGGGDGARVRSRRDTVVVVGVVTPKKQKTKKHGGYLFDGANERVARRRLCWCGYSGGESEHGCDVDGRAPDLGAKIDQRTLERRDGDVYREQNTRVRYAYTHACPLYEIINNITF